MSSIKEQVENALTEAKNVVFGQDELLDSIVAALVCEGHLLVEGMPGLGKTLSISVMAKLCELDFKRIQFTPDLLPSDLVGTMIYSQKEETFKTKFGPIFTQILLADEINRSPAKVQSALLEAMAEKQVTIGEESHRLPTPFVVLATQNPIEQEGTYPLPEAQMDRFMMKIHVDYPSGEAEKSILSLDKNPLHSVRNQLNGENLLSIQQEVEKVYVDEKIKDYIIRLSQATRPQSNNFPKKYKGIIQAGVSPRASIWLYRLGRFRAFMDGKDHVTPEHILKLVPEVLGHRIILTYEASVDSISAKEAVVDIAQQVIE